MAKSDRGLCCLLLAFTWAGDYYVNEPLNQSTFIYKGLITTKVLLHNEDKTDWTSQKKHKRPSGQENLQQKLTPGGAHLLEGLG